MAWWKIFGLGKDKHRQEQMALMVGQLVLAVMRILETSSADAFKTLAIACRSQASPATIKFEILLFHKFLLLQACAYDKGFPQDVINEVVRLLDDAFVFYAQERMGLTIEESNQLHALGVLRARQYDEPFYIDRTSSESGRGNVPWKRLLVTLCRNLRVPSDEEQIFSLHAVEAKRASFAIEATLDVLIDHVGQAMRSHLRRE
jgi:hypothetical protein